MRTVFVFTLLFAFISSGRSDTRVDSIINNLTLREKVDLLFIAPSKGWGDSIVVGDQISEPLSIYDAYTGLNDSLDYDFPDATTYYCIGDNNLKESIRKATLNVCVNSGYDGVITPGNKIGIASLDIKTDSFQIRARHQIIDFPKDVYFEELNNSVHSNNGIEPSLKEQKFDESGLSILNIWKRTPQFDISLTKLLERDILFWRTEDQYGQQLLEQIFLEEKIDASLLDHRVRKLIQLQLIKSNPKPDVLSDDYWELMMHKASKQSISLYQRESLLPIKRIDSTLVSVNDLTSGQGQQFIHLAKYYQPTVRQSDSIAYVQIVLCNQEDSLASFVDRVNVNLTRNHSYILIYAGGISEKLANKAADVFKTILTMPKETDQSWSLMAQAVYGGAQVNGYSIYNDLFENSLLKREAIKKNRIGFAYGPDRIIPRDSIAKIEKIINEAIREKAMPGCQLLVVNKGEIITQKSYGFHTYNKKVKVKNDDLYDVASITKLAVTFPLVMQLYDEGVLDLDAPIVDYIPEVDTTDKANITIRELLLHQSGLISYIPFHNNFLDRESLRRRSLYSRHYSRIFNVRVDTRLYQNKNARFRKDVFSSKAKESFNLQLSGNMFMNANCVDSMYYSIYESPLRSLKNYQYSDLGYYILQKIIEKEEKVSIDTLFYKRLTSLTGGSRLLYKPLDQFSVNEIVPTENDLAFRKELLHGFVHDQGAAMLGGVAAHAGLFANAGDLAKLAQMMLNEGSYGGIQFINPKTIGYFTQNNQYGNRRGLGVDKPQLKPDEDSHVSKMASQSSFGHTGFTGTIMWIDPEHELIYIFLSNRIHPRAYNKKLIEMNVRTQIQDVIYHSIVK